ncbi:MAG: hypothetical protein DHS20C01_15170 [marine bacterium B5-7]|nr:MAG: hypothetical protein DHS20C01_15170 [marine bacterium B5-7]
MGSTYPVTRVALGQCAVEIECRATELADALANLLKDTRADGGKVQTRFILEKTPDDRFNVLRDDSVCYTAKTVGSICTYLVGEIIYHLIENNSNEVLLHTACVRRDGVGMLLPGVSGAGKSTMSAWLLSRGFEYLSDELVCLDTNTLEVEAFTRPLNIKHGGMEAIRCEFGEDFGKNEILEGAISHLVPHRLLQPNYAGSRTTINVIVFPKYVSSDDFSLERLSTAKTALLLMQTFVNARNHVEHGFHHITALARTVRGYHMHYSNFAQLEALERELTKPTLENPGFLPDRKTVS